MTDALAGAKGDWNPEASYDGWVEKMIVAYPTLTSALIGEVDWEKGAGRRPPLSLIITNRDGKLKFTLSNPEWPSTYHCQVTDATDVLASVERALAANMGEWVRKRANGGGTGRRG
jgi:hypothetical protein